MNRGIIALIAVGVLLVAAVVGAVALIATHGDCDSGVHGRGQMIAPGQQGYGDQAGRAIGPGQGYGNGPRMDGNMGPGNGYHQGPWGARQVGDRDGGRPVIALLLSLVTFGLVAGLVIMLVTWRPWRRSPDGSLVGTGTGSGAAFATHEQFEAWHRTAHAAGMPDDVTQMQDTVADTAVMVTEATATDASAAADAQTAATDESADATSSTGDAPASET